MASSVIDLSAIRTDATSFAETLRSGILSVYSRAEIDNSVVKLTGDQTIAGKKEFYGASATLQEHKNASRYKNR